MMCRALISPFVKVPAGSLLSRLPSGVLTRNAFVCPYGTFRLEPGNGSSQNYTDVCRECPEVVPSDVACHVIKRILSPRFLSVWKRYDVASEI
jgi:hypothetical protein